VTAGTARPVSNQPAPRTVSSVFVNASDLTSSEAQARRVPVPPPALCGMCQAPVVKGERYCATCAWEVNPTVPDDASKRAAALMKQTQFINAHHVKAALTANNRVVVLNPDGTEGIVYHLNAAQCVCGSVNGVVLLDDVHVSPTHCVFRYLEGVLSVEDAGSVNGVYIKLRAPVPLNVGDFLRLGGQTLQVDDVRAHAMAPPLRQPEDASPVMGTPVQQGFRLVEVQEGGGVGDSRVVRGKGMTLGRGDVDWVFPEDDRVSARHCSVALEAGTLLLRDLTSRNGTYVRLQAEQELKDGDELMVGSHRLRVDILT
jgi:pSer/pThr/pTyr-binding forkhead associated (FHA) protein